MLLRTFCLLSGIRWLSGVKPNVEVYICDIFGGSGARNRETSDDLHTSVSNTALRVFIRFIDLHVQGHYIEQQIMAAGEDPGFV